MKWNVLDLGRLNIEYYINNFIFTVTKNVNAVYEQEIAIDNLSKPIENSLDKMFLLYYLKAIYNQYCKHHG